MCCNQFQELDALLRQPTVAGWTKIWTERQNQIEHFQLNQATIEVPRFLALAANAVGNDKFSMNEYCSVSAV